MKKIDREEMYDFISDFYNRYNQVPCIGFLAGWYKVSMQRIRDLIRDFADEGRMKLIKKNKNIVGYLIIKN